MKKDKTNGAAYRSESATTVALDREDIVPIIRQLAQAYEKGATSVQLTKWQPGHKDRKGQVWGNSRPSVLPKYKRP